MSRILWTIPIHIAPDEPDVWINYRTESGQRAVTNTDPYFCYEGHPTEIEIVGITGVQRTITSNEMECFLESKVAMTILDGAILEREESMRQQAREREWA